MIRTTRRAALMGALAVPTVAGLAHWRWRHGERSVLLHGPALAAGRRFAEAGAAGEGWVEALADYASRPGEAAGRVLSGALPGPHDAGLVLGWVLAPR